MRCVAKRAMKSAPPQVSAVRRPRKIPMAYRSHAGEKMPVKRRIEQNSESVDSMVLNQWILEESNDIRYVPVLHGDR